MAFSFDSDNRWHDQYFEQGMTVSGETTSANALAVGQHHGALAIVVSAAEAGSVASGTVTFKDDDAETGSFSTSDGAPVLTITSAAVEAGDVIAKYVLPDTKRYVKAVLGGTWPSKVDVTLQYLAR